MTTKAKPKKIAAALGLAGACAFASPAGAAPDLARRIQVLPEGTIITPGSSVPAPNRVHTNFHIFVPAGGRVDHPFGAAPGGKFETPASLACVYGLTAAVKGCNPETLTAVPTTGSRMIAIVDAYDDPNAAADLNTYSTRYGLPPITSANFQVVFANGKQPKQDPAGDWEVEESLDIEMAHALAPKAKIILVEAASANFGDLIKAENVASAMVAAAGGGEVSNSWGSGEVPSEAAYKNHFKTPGVVYFASSGDNPGPSVPSILPNVVSVGGTSINRNSAGVFQSQTTWSIDGGGASAYLPIPAYQAAVTAIVGTHRADPDIAMIANPLTGPWVYDSTPYSGSVLGWFVIGGTSVASPAAAALVNSAGSFKTTTLDELTEIYADLGNSKAFTDITVGSCVNAASSMASKGYDLCTGVGAPFGLLNK